MLQLLDECSGIDVVQPRDSSEQEVRQNKQ